MAKYQSVFQRVEKKYLLTREQYEKLKITLKPYTVPDTYEISQISNIYFDTENYQLIRTSLEKPVFKEKLRLRCYGKVQENGPSYIEIKRKYKGIVYKRREGVELKRAVRYLYHPGNGDALDKNSQIANEIEYFKHFYQGLKPAMYLYYDRTAWVGKRDLELRITFDKNILWRTEHLNLTEGVWGNPLFDKDLILMEIKIPGAMPLWLPPILEKLEIYPTSFSKYGRAYMAMLLNDIKQEEAVND